MENEGLDKSSRHCGRCSNHTQSRNYRLKWQNQETQRLEGIIISQEV